MPIPDYVVPVGDVVAAPELVSSKAKDLARRLDGGDLRFARLLECRQLPGIDVVVLEVDVEVVQRPVNDIRELERLAVVFSDSGRAAPEVLALRTDFPAVPHLNVRLFELPRSLCLSDEAYPDQKRRWTSAVLVNLIREWLRLTARGELHASDQPLEPLLLETDGRVIVPNDLFDQPTGSEVDAALVPIVVVRTEIQRGKVVLIVDRGSDSPDAADRASIDAIKVVAAAITCVPQQHGVIRRTPRSLDQLHDLLANSGNDLLALLRQRLARWKDSQGALDSRLLLVIAVPKTRSAGGPVEATDMWAFLTSTTVKETGLHIDLWNEIEGHLGAVLAADPQMRGQNIGLGPLNVTLTLTRNMAAALNGHGSPTETTIVAVGAGALGSQIIVNAARAGYGRWTIVDDDLLLPHNLARHALGQAAVGRPKAVSLASESNGFIDGPAAFHALVANVLDPGADVQASLSEEFASADVIVDMSASISVARHLARGIDASGRRISLFLNPTGTDLVLLAEDKQRSVPLDALEMQYYRALARTESLRGHLPAAARGLRYGRSCRDVSMVLPQELVGLHAAIASRALRSAIATDSATICIWRADPETMSVVSVAVAPSRVCAFTQNGWTIVLDDAFLQTILTCRAAKLPNETGGVLLGSIDLERRIIFVVDTIPSPPDSEEWPTLYIRGCKGLFTKARQISAITGEEVQYIGEWHSHPDGYDCRPSAADVEVFGWLTAHLDKDGLPALMMIAGEGGVVATFVGRMIAGELPPDDDWSDAGA